MPVPGYMRAEIFERDAYVCHWCQCALVDSISRNRRELSDGARLAVLDHKLPRARGGSDREHNLVAACARCKLDREMEIAHA